MESLDTILSGQGEATPAPEAKPETPAPEAAKPEGTEPHDEVVDQPDGRKLVPLEALTEARGKVKRYTEEVADFRKQLTETNAAWERRMAQLVEAVKPKQEAPQAPDIFENAPEAIRHTVAPQFDQINQTLMANAQLVASVKYGDDKVAEAEKAFLEAINAQRIEPEEFRKVVGSPNRYAAAVQWHQRQLAQAEIGDDPAAFRQKVEAEVLEKYGIKPGEQPVKQAPQVMPSNLANARNVGTRAGPAWSGPTALADIFKR